MALASLNTTITLALSVSDRHASADWYESHLGFTLLYHADEAGWSELATRSPDVTLGLGEHTKPAPGNCVPVFGTDDLDGDRASLEGAGVRFDGATEVIDGMVKTATFYDPDDNAMMLAEDLSGNR